MLHCGVPSGIATLTPRSLGAPRGNGHAGCLLLEAFHVGGMDCALGPLQRTVTEPGSPPVDPTALAHVHTCLHLNALSSGTARRCQRPFVDCIARHVMSHAASVGMSAKCIDDAVFRTSMLTSHLMRALHTPERSIHRQTVVAATLLSSAPGP